MKGRVQTMRTGSMQGSRRLFTVLTYFFLIAGSVLMVFPFLWMILTSLKSLGESMQIPPTFFPAVYYFNNFKERLANFYWTVVTFYIISSSHE